MNLEKGEIFLENDFYKRAGGFYRTQKRKNYALLVLSRTNNENLRAVGSIAHK